MHLSTLEEILQYTIYILPFFRVAKNLMLSGYYVRYLKECVLIYISMSIIKKVFSYEETELPVIKYKDEIWFRGKTIAEILGYAIQRKAIREHVDPEDRVRPAQFKLLGQRTDAQIEALPA